MASYPFQSIVCNGRDVMINDIITHAASPTTPFEVALFNFIAQWLGGANEFTLTTSGSTGTPKKIVLYRRQMVASAQRTAQALQLQLGQTSLICLNPEYIAGKMMVVRSLESGLAITAVNPASNPLTNVTQQIDFAAMVPLQIHELLQHDRNAFHQLSTVIVGGGPVDAQDLSRIKALSCRFYATYGMTETISHVALQKLNGGDASAHYQALPGITFSRDDRDCLVIHCPELTDPVVTNDVVDLVDDTKFTWLGRFDNVINSGGIKVIPENLEEIIAPLLRRTGHHGRFFISGLPDERLGSKVVLVIEDELIGQNYNDLRTILKSSLQSHELPREFLFSSRFVETQTGKTNRRATLELAISNRRSPD